MYVLPRCEFFLVILASLASLLSMLCYLMWQTTFVDVHERFEFLGFGDEGLLVGVNSD